MRIAFALPRCTSENSHGRYVVELAARLAASVSVEIWSGAFSPRVRDVATCRPLPVVNRPMAARLATLWMSSLLVRRSARIDLLHVQGADAPIGDVVTAHCCNVAMRDAVARHARFRRRVNYEIGIAAEKYCLTRTSTRRLIAVSAKVAREIEFHYRVNPARIAVISPGVSLTDFSPAQRSARRSGARSALGLRPDHFVVLFVGADYALKGFLTLLEAATTLPTHVRIVGVGVPQTRTVQTSIAACRLEDRVTLVPATPDIGAFYAVADCFALPTRYDTFSLVALEAMACGLPVIVSRAAGVAEYLTPGVDALLLDRAEDAAGLTEHLQALVDGPTLAARMGEAARRTAERHSWDAVARRVLDLYRSLEPTR